MGITATFRQGIDALLLRDSAYLAMREESSPFVRGLIFVIGVGLIVALFGTVGSVLLQATSPDLGAIQDAVWQGMQEMPWVDEIPPGERATLMAEIEQGYDLGWQVARAFAPSVGSAVINLILNPIGLVVGWLIYGFLAFLSARALGGKGRLDQTYGATALAVAPRMLGVVNVLPYVETAGLGFWALLCNYLALKNIHGLSPWRSFWAAVIPFILLFLFVVGLIILGVVIAVAAFGGGAQ